MSSSTANGIGAALRARWIDLCAEAASLGLFMLSACACVVWLEHPASALHQAIPSAFVRRAWMGLAMGLTAIGLIYSPWGRRSGAHMNPSVTLAFARLGRVRAIDAALYIVAQVIGGVLGVGLAALLFGERLADPSTHFAATVPGEHGALIAFAAEVTISFALFAAVERVGSSRHSRYGGLLAGALVGLWILFEAPLSGMSMNPARTIASALFAHDWTGFWIYATAPLLGMQLAAHLFRRTDDQDSCAKLVHADGARCLFCERKRGEVRPHRIVIVGGGFGAVFCARALEKLLRSRANVEVTLCSKDNFFVFQPMLPEVISGTIGLLDLVSPLRHLLPRTKLCVREVESIDLQHRRVITAPGFHARPHVLEYDQLVLAPGTVTDFRGLRGLPEHAMPFKNLQDALALRNHLIRTLDEASLEAHDPELRRQLLTFVVAGGGFSGVEVVAELNDFVRQAARTAGIDAQELRVVLVHSQDRILPEVSAELSLFAQKILRERGVELLLNQRLSAASASEAVLGDGARIPTRTLVSTIPSSPHPLVDALQVPKERGRICADASLAVENTPGVWALGDCARVPAPGGGVSPPTAQHAIRQAELVARNLVASLEHRPLATFQFGGLGKMGSLGRRSAVAEIFGVKLSGALAWFVWRTIYLLKLPGWGRRAKVAAAWTFDLFLPPDQVQLRLQSASLLRREHYEPGQEIFRQGDLGDRVYAILSGQAEVLVGEGAAQRQVAQLRDGDVFGEMAVLDNSTRSATVRSLTSLDVWSLPKRDFETLAQGVPDLRRGLERVRASRTPSARVNA
ncbi:MAG: FAD-dependent oxidoreductase [Deltaproteobacteria bacterium]|nr:FAD-dependent oxidoreductase [Deltaproteobacteria bacterium]